VIELDLPGARVAFTTRHGGVSEGAYASLNLGVMTDDEEARVRENRRRVAAHIGVPLALSRQVHGTAIREWAAPPAKLVATDDADGHVTSAHGLAPFVLTADCLPVALAAPGRVAILHCGWRGLAAGILARALERFADPPAAAIGPGIGPCCYEVGPEVLAAFGVAQGPTLDLKAIAREQLAACGVERVEDVDLCTSCREDLFFSHRRDRGVTGRQAGIVWLT
jgi:polyphenol oxidase